MSQELGGLGGRYRGSSHSLGSCSSGSNSLGSHSLGGSFDGDVEDNNIEDGGVDDDVKDHQAEGPASKCNVSSYVKKRSLSICMSSDEKNGPSQPLEKTNEEDFHSPFLLSKSRARSMPTLPRVSSRQKLAHGTLKSSNHQVQQQRNLLTNSITLPVRHAQSTSIIHEGCANRGSSSANATFDMLPPSCGGGAPNATFETIMRREEEPHSGSPGRSDEEVSKRSLDCGGLADEPDGPPAKFAKPKSGDAKSKRQEEERNKWNSAFGIGKGGAGGLLSGIYTADEGQRKLLDRLREKQRQAEEKMKGDVVADENRRKWGWVKVGTKWCTKG